MRTNLTLRHIKIENKIPIKKDLDELKTVTNVRFRKAIYSGCEYVGEVIPTVTFEFSRINEGLFQLEYLKAQNIQYKY